MRAQRADSLPAPRLGLVKHRVGETPAPEALRRLAREGKTRTRAAEELGVHRSTLDRVARVYRIAFPSHTRGYGWRGVERRIG